MVIPLTHVGRCRPWSRALVALRARELGALISSVGRTAARSVLDTIHHAFPALNTLAEAAAWCHSSSLVLPHPRCDLGTHPAPGVLSS